MKKCFFKIRFDLDVDEDGFPPVGSESLNAIALGANKFQIDNTPFFIECVAVGDVVEAYKSPSSGDKFVFSKFVSISKDQSLSVVFLDEDFIEEVFDKLKQLGCYCEYGEFNNGNLKMVAINVPSLSIYHDVMSFLLKLESTEVLSVSELSVKDSDVK